MKKKNSEKKDGTVNVRCVEKASTEYHAQLLNMIQQHQFISLNFGKIN